jgi:RNA polymerase sigma factor (sigma-70 family)
MDVLGAEESARLAQRIHRGDRTAEATLVRHYCDCVFKMAVARTRDRDAARELMDDVLMAVIMALRHGTVRDCNHLGGFVHGTAVNTINSYMRRQRHRLSTVALDPGLPIWDSRDDYTSQDRQSMARDAMALLDEQDRKILLLSLAEGLKPGEIAARLGLSPIVVRQRKCRALRAIVTYVGEGPGAVRARRMLRR